MPTKASGTRGTAAAVTSTYRARWRRPRATSSTTATSCVSTGSRPTHRATSAPPVTPSDNAPRATASRCRPSPHDFVLMRPCEIQCIERTSFRSTTSRRSPTRRSASSVTASSSVSIATRGWGFQARIRFAGTRILPAGPARRALPIPTARQPGSTRSLARAATAVREKPSA